MVDGLRRLRAVGTELVLVTNGTVRQQSAKLERTGLGPLLDRVIVSEEVGVKKPDPQIFEIALGRSAADARTWMVGDHPAADVDGARAMGLRARRGSPTGGRGRIGGDRLSARGPRPRF